MNGAVVWQDLARSGFFHGQSLWETQKNRADSQDIARLAHEQSAKRVPIRRRLSQEKLLELDMTCLLLHDTIDQNMESTAWTEAITV
jgi:hypothetical protein